MSYHKVFLLPVFPQNTFQFIYCGDQKSSRAFVFYIYKDIQWEDSGRLVGIGFSIESRQSGPKVNYQDPYSNVPGSLTTTTYKIDDYDNQLLGLLFVYLCFFKW